MITTRFVSILINIIIGIIEFFLGLRVLLKLLGANAQAPFVAWVYESSATFAAPFIGMFPSARIVGSMVVEFSAIFALMVYAFIAFAMDKVFDHIALTMDRKRVIDQSKPKQPVQGGHPTQVPPTHTTPMQ